MRKAVDATDVDEGAILDKTLDRTADDLPDFKLREDLFLLLLALFLQEAAARKNETLLADVDLDRQSFHRLADIDGKILDEVKLHLRRGNEASQTVNGCDETTLDDLRDLRLHSLSFFFQRLDLLPCDHAVSANLGNRSAILTAEAHDEDLDLVVDLHDILGGIRLR